MDKICGVDRYEHSKDYGKKVVNEVYLWSRPGARVNAKNLRGLVAHGDKVEVLDKKQYKTELWCKVSCTKYPDKQEGWLKAVLLKKEGRDRPGIRPLGILDRVFVKLGRVLGKAVKLAKG